MKKKVNTVDSESKIKKLSIDLKTNIKKLDKEAEKEKVNKDNWNRLHSLLFSESEED